MSRKKKVTLDVTAGDTADYNVAHGVTIVNGQPVRGRKVRLTLAEALFDLSLGRIEPVKALSEKPADDGDGDGDGDGRD